MGVQAPFVSADSSTEAFSRRARQTRILVDATRDLTNNPRPSARQIEAYKELFYQLADRLLPADRRLISTLVARSAFTPRAVALYLAQDTLDVAIPCLLYSPVLQDLDLKEIARKMGAAHRDVIAKRTIPPLQMSDLQDKTEPVEEVAEATSEAEALPAEWMESVEMPAIVSSSIHQPSLFARTPTQASLIEEAAQETETAATRETDGWADGHADGKADQSTIEATEGEAEWLDGEEIVALASAGGRLGRQKPAIQEAIAPEDASAAPPESRRKHLDLLPARETRHLLALARSQNRKALVRKLGDLSGLGRNTVATLLRKTTGDEIVYLVRALNPGRRQELKLLLMVAPRYGRSPDAYRGARDLLGQLDTGICRMIFNQVGAAFPLPELETIGQRGIEPDTEFARAARYRREEIGHALDGRSVAARPFPGHAGQDRFTGQTAQPASA